MLELLSHTLSSDLFTIGDSAAAPPWENTVCKLELRALFAQRSERTVPGLAVVDR